MTFPITSRYGPICCPSNDSRSLDLSVDAEKTRKYLLRFGRGMNIHSLAMTTATKPTGKTSAPASAAGAAVHTGEARAPYTPALRTSQVTISRGTDKREAIT